MIDYKWVINTIPSKTRNPSQKNLSTQDTVSKKSILSGRINLRTKKTLSLYGRWYSKCRNSTADASISVDLVSLYFFPTLSFQAIVSASQPRKSRTYSRRNSANIQGLPVDLCPRKSSDF